MRWREMGDMTASFLSASFYSKRCRLAAHDSPATFAVASSSGAYFWLSLMANDFADFLRKSDCAAYAIAACEALRR